MDRGAWWNTVPVVTKNQPDTTEVTEHTGMQERKKDIQVSSVAQYSCLEKSHGWRSLLGCRLWGCEE